MTFLTKCANCGALIPPNAICPGCFHASEDCFPSNNVALRVDYAKSMSRHNRNYTIFVLLILSSAFIALLTAFMWKLFIYRGNVLALRYIAVFTILTAMLGFITTQSRKWFPIEVFCPSCKTRIDELGLKDGRCEGCNATLK